MVRGLGSISYRVWAATPITPAPPTPTQRMFTLARLPYDSCILMIDNMSYVIMRLPIELWLCD